MKNGKYKVGTIKIDRNVNLYSHHHCVDSIEYDCAVALTGVVGAPDDDVSKSFAERISALLNAAQNVPTELLVEENLLLITRDRHQKLIDAEESLKRMIVASGKTRDEFAIAAMQGELASQSEFTGLWSDFDRLAKYSYDIADAMMVQRDKL